LAADVTVDNPENSSGLVLKPRGEDDQLLSKRIKLSALKYPSLG
jgi:hypothetical protein